MGKDTGTGPTPGDGGPSASAARRQYATLQSAVLAYRQRLSGPEVLLVTSKFTRRWVLPKGMIEPGMTAYESAAKEAFEEAGITGFVSRRCLGTYRYAKASREGLRPCVVRVYPMKVWIELRDWPERRQRRRAWMTIEAAIRSVREPQLKRILNLFRITFPDRSLSPTVSGGHQRRR